MTPHGWTMRGFIASLTVLVGVSVGCGEEARPKAGASEPWAAEDPSKDGSTGNMAPEIRSLEIEPREILPGTKATARVVAVDPDRDPVELGLRWTLNDRPLEANGETVVVPAWARRGDRLTLRVLASDGEANSEPEERVVEVANRPPRITDLELLERPGDGDDGAQWVADPTVEDPDGDEISLRFEWYVNGEGPVSQEPFLERAPRNRGDEIHLVVKATDGQDESPPLRSAPFVVGNSPPEIVSRPPGLDSAGRFAYAVDAVDPDGDRGLRYSLIEGPDGMTIDPFSGEVRWKASLRDVGEHLVEISVEDRQGGESRQSFFVNVQSS